MIDVSEVVLEFRDGEKALKKFLGETHSPQDLQSHGLVSVAVEGRLVDADDVHVEFSRGIERTTVTVTELVTYGVPCDPTKHTVQVWTD